jgi:hypothetical protein
VGDGGTVDVGAGVAGGAEVVEGVAVGVGLGAQAASKRIQ